MPNVEETGLEEHKCGREAFKGKLTSNNYGTMYERFDEFADLGIKLIERRDSPTVLDLGCAYGFLTKALLANESNATIKVIANDISLDHLNVLRDSLASEPQKASRLELAHGNSLDMQFGDHSLDAVFALRVLHFLSGAEIRDLLAKVYRWLKPGGCLVVSCASPFSWCFEQEFWPTYKKRVDQGAEWPGVLSAHDLKQFITSAKVADQIPQSLHVFTVEILVREAANAGLSVLKSGYVNRVTYQNGAIEVKNRNDYACMVAVKGMFE